MLYVNSWVWITPYEYPHPTFFAIFVLVNYAYYSLYAAK